MSPVAKHVLKANLTRCFKLVAMATGICRSVPKRIYFLNNNIRLLFCTATWLLLKNVKLAGTFNMKKPQESKNCGFRIWGNGHELAL